MSKKDIQKEPTTADLQEEQSPAQKEPIELLQEQYDALNDKYLRLMAEYDNFRKRSIKERDDIYPNATANAITKFLGVLDSFEFATQFESGTEDFCKGFEMIYKNFKDVLSGFGVETIGEVGEPFNPDIHNAVMHIEDENLGDNVVSMVMQKGYKTGNKVIRYAMVQTAN